MLQQQTNMFDNSVASIVDKFKDNSVDFHQIVADMANISRTQAKTINLGLFYGMGKAKLQAELGLNKKKKLKNYLILIIPTYLLLEI